MDKVIKETNDVIYKQDEFSEGRAKGFSYIYPQVKSLAAAVNLFGSEAELLERINNILKSLVSEKVRTNKLPKNVTKEREKEIMEGLATSYPDGILFSLTEAEIYKPGQRELGIDKSLENLVESIDTLTPEQIVERARAISQKKKINGV